MMLHRNQVQAEQAEELLAQRIQSLWAALDESLRENERLRNEIEQMKRELDELRQ